MKKIVWVLVISLTLIHCAGEEESPLILPAAAEPSAKMHNDRGISDYRKGRYMDALLHFNQARTADKTAGEIHFNLGLVLLKRGEEQRAIEHFKLARKYANGNTKILESKVLKKYLDRGGNP